MQSVLSSAMPPFLADLTDAFQAFFNATSGSRLKQKLTSPLDVILTPAQAKEPAPSSTNRAPMVWPPLASAFFNRVCGSKTMGAWLVDRGFGPSVFFNLFCGSPSTSCPLNSCMESLCSASSVAFTVGLACLDGASPPPPPDVTMMLAAWQLGIAAARAAA